jgi:hypothetical protein
MAGCRMWCHIVNKYCIFHPLIPITQISNKIVPKVLDSPPKDCMTLTLVVGLAWSNKSRSYAGGSVATGRVSHARLVCDEDPD